MKLNNKLIRIFYEKVSEYKNTQLKLSEFNILPENLNEEELLYFNELDEFEKVIYPWQQHFDEESEEYFYLNIKNNEVLKELPRIYSEKLKQYNEYVSVKEELKEINMLNYINFSNLRTYNNNWKDKPAPKQLEESLAKQYAYRQNDEEYNIWYNKYLTDELIKEKKAALTICDPDLHSGYTKADYSKGNSYFCCHFVRGSCSLGVNCIYYHHIPSVEECLKIDNGKDIFGRSRYSTYRKDKQGIGNFLKECRTLLVIDFFMPSDGENKIASVYEIIYRFFSLWGIIEEIVILITKGKCYIRYIHRCMAEYAKEAMRDQSWENNEILVIKWAETDNLSIDKLDYEEIIENKIINKKIKKGELINNEIKKREVQEELDRKIKIQNDPTKIFLESEFSLYEQQKIQSLRNKQKLQKTLNKIENNKSSLFNKYK